MFASAKICKNRATLNTPIKSNKSDFVKCYGRKDMCLKIRLDIL